ncbi:MAG TPA: glutamyl-tRNA reductase [Vulgatibacter sp.]|nr:glutamyl-tRNA reductase [Vulgatibacter sp.]
MTARSELILVGLSHHTAPVAVRERIAVAEGAVDEALGRLRALPGIDETFVVSTCNRVEVYAATGGAPEEAGRAIRGWLSAQDASIDSHLYERHGLEAVRHLFRVCASLDSMVVGEPQILGQVKEAFATAERAGAVGGLLARCCRRAFTVAKRVRNETQVGKLAVSMSFAAVELATKILGSLDGKAVLLVGAGKMSALAARHLLGAGVGRVAVINRSRERADELAREIGGESFAWDTLQERLAEADVVVCSTAAPQPVIVREMVQAARKARRHRPLFFIDLAVPRDVDPRVNELDGIFVYDVDDLDKVVDENRRARAGEAARAEGIVDQEAGAFLAATRSEAAPIVRELRLRGEAIARHEVERTLARFGDSITPEQRKSVDALARAIVNKLLHEPTARIREAGERDDGALLRAAVRLFGIEGGPAGLAVVRPSEPPDGPKEGAPAPAVRDATRPTGSDG